VKKLDHRVLRLHQWLVDWSQRKPTWWIENCDYGYGILALMCLFFGKVTWSTYLLAFLVLVNAGFFLLVCKVELLRKSVAELYYIRLFFLAFLITCFAIRISGLFMGRPVMVDDLAGLISDVCFIGMYYFSACEDPKPKEPRRAPVPETA
jgi:hypothetical protein